MSGALLRVAHTQGTRGPHAWPARVQKLTTPRSVYGSFFWPEWSAPRYILGFSLTCSFAFFALLVVLFAKWKFGDTGVTRTS